MVRKLLGSCVILVAIVAVILCVVLGKDTVTDIAGGVLSAAREELGNQIQEKLEEYKVEVVETKTTAGKLNDDGGELQFYCAALIRTNSEESAKDCAEALKKLFGESGYALQTAKTVENKHLVHKTLSYSHEDYSEGNLYTVYVYSADVSKIIDLEAVAEKLKEATGK